MRSSTTRARLRRATALALLGATLAACGAKTPLREWDATPRDAADVPDAPAPDVPPPNNVGREYWTVSTLNAALGSLPDPSNDNTAVGVDGFPFAIAVANPSGARATVRIDGGALTAELVQTVEPGQLQIIRLPWVQAISQVAQRGSTGGEFGTSAYASGAGYHVQSDVAVAVYQFNPLSYQDVRRQLCSPDDMSCYTYTNDSSLLLPVDSLAGDYTVIAWPSQAGNFGGVFSDGGGGFVTIVATQTPTTVTVRLTGGVRAGNGVAAAPAGSVLTRTMSAGDVWQLVSAAIPPDRCGDDPDPMCQMAGAGWCGCVPYPEVDLTGSVVQADAPVAVFAGHDCADVPFDRGACDHLEEQLFPSQTLGSHYVVSHTHEVLSAGEPNLVRVMSDRDGNAVTFSPATVHAPVTLDRGQWVEFTHRDHFEVTGSAPLTVAQYLVGQSYFSVTSAPPEGSSGDPSMSLEVPEAQWRTRYEFLSPPTYPLSFVNVVAPQGTRIMLDGRPLAAWAEHVGSYDVYRENLSDRPGAHHIESAGGQAFGIKAYGFGSYTSYMNPGGLDLRAISPGR